MEIYLRGSLGTQVLQVMGGFAHAIETGDQVTNIVHSVGGDIADHSHVNYVSRIFNLKPYHENGPHGRTNEIKKSPSWDYENIRHILKHRNRILNELSFPNTHYENIITIFHARFGDRQLLSANEYMEKFYNLCKKNPKDIIFTISDDPTQAKALGLSPVMMTENGAVSDWEWTLDHAKRVVGPLSTFTFSMLMIDPDKDIKFFKEADSNGPHKMVHGEYQLLQRLLDKGLLPFSGWAE